ncbi:ribosomal L1 domain-containing protein CG13096 [Leptidea sinapis]|uniref:Uncharacterized protein n=1 Tax=Leptidea sinapis TaxID=189913 RepID=A0A5E4PMS1_9NEOP|nr:ribosomal L1 domain-containing protein CG13096 [Leptidea sinapis]VVC87308.1 unnamed protein product [Leptidea sinapis]
MVAIKVHNKPAKREKIKGKKSKIEKVSKVSPISKEKIIGSEELQQKSTSGQDIIKSKVKYTMPSKGVTSNTVDLSLHALKKISEHYNTKNLIFGDETQIFMEIRCIRMPNTKSNIKFVLPHSTVASSGEVCLITPDIKKGKKVDHEPTVERWEDILRKAGVTSVKTVLPMRQLRVEYDQFELKRRLMTQHDCIMVDNRILSHVTHLLGSKFLKKQNMLIPVKINENKDIKQQIDIGLRTVMLRLSEGLTSTVTVGHTGMPQAQIKENILSVIKYLGNRYPGGEANIRSLSIKLPLSVSIPLYITLRSANTVVPPKIKQNKPKEYKDYEGELTTQPGSIVRIAPDGTVHLKKQNVRNSDESDIDEESAEEKEDINEEDGDDDE